MMGFGEMNVPVPTWGALSAPTAKQNCPALVTALLLSTKITK